MAPEAMSGLGISFSPEPPVHQKAPQHQQQQRQRPRANPSYSSLSSAASSSGSERGGLPRRPASSVDRRVRIASGLPGILGADTESDVSPRSDVDTASLLSLSTLDGRDAHGQGRTQRLGAAVAAMQGAQAPTSYSSSGSSNGRGGVARRAQTIRKQASQPILSRSSTMRFPVQSAIDAPSMSRSQSQVSLSSAYKSSGGQSASSGLGRTSEIPRSVSRTQRGPRARARTLDASDAAPTTTTRRVPDGFGGFTEVTEPASAADQGSSGPQSSRAFDGPALRATAPEFHPSPTESQITRISSYSAPSAAHNQQQEQPRPRPLSAHPVLRVGSFYGADGVERAHLDADGRLSRAGTSVAPSESCSQIGRQRSQSGGLPRAHLMTGPDAAQSIGPHDAGAPAEAVTRGIGNMRSVRGFRGLEGAERGEAMVSLDSLDSRFQLGEAIIPGRVRTAEEESILGSDRPDHSRRQSISGTTVAGTEVGPGDSISNVGTGVRAPSRMRSNSAASSGRPRSASSAAGLALERSGTLLSQAGNPARRTRELNRLLDPGATRAGKTASVVSSSSASSAGTSAASEASLGSSRGLSRSNAVGPASAPPAVLEHGRSGKARVEVDVVLESDLVVEGGMLRGRLEIKVRRSADKNGGLMLAQPKIRVVGFEELLNDDTRHIFYHHATVIDGDRSSGGPSEAYVLAGSPDMCSPQAEGRAPLPCFASPPDSEGYSLGAEGNHQIPFALELPIGKGAKGSFRGKHAVVRYIVIGSVKLKSAEGSNRSIAHFYRHVELFPYLNPAVVLSTAPKPIQARASKGLFLGGPGKVHLSASLHRSTWVAGQRVHVNVAIKNDTSKKVKNITLALVRTVTLYRPRPELDMGISSSDDPTGSYIDPDACTTSTSRKKISEETLELGQKAGGKGVVTARGWWTGVESNCSVDFSHYMRLPSDALSVSRGRHVEVMYSIKVSVSSSLSADVSVELPLRVVNFVSLDPPPLKPLTSGAALSEVAPMARTWSQASSATQSEVPMIERVRSMEALRSPGKVEHIQTAPRPRLPLPPLGDQQQQYLQPEANPARRLQHQKSLDFINHAIRSATARRGGLSSGEPSPMGLGIDVPAGSESNASSSPYGDQTPQAASSSSGSSISHGVGPVHPSCLPYEHRESYANIPGVGTVPYVQVRSVALDDADDNSDDGDAADRTLGLNDDSVDEVDFVIGSARLSEGSPEFDSVPQHHSALFATNMDEADLSVDSDATAREDDSIRGEDVVREEDEYDEEEERLKAREAIERQRRERHAQQLELQKEQAALEQAQKEHAAAETVQQHSLSAGSSREQDEYAEYEAATRTAAPPTATRPESRLAEIDESAEEAATPIARSPAKMAAAPTASASSPAPSLRATATAQPAASSPVVRVRVNSTQGATRPPLPRPVSPSKAAASPPKSALKSKSSFTFATSNAPLKAKPTVTPQLATAGSAAPVALRAKVSASQVVAPPTARGQQQTQPGAKAKQGAALLDKPQPEKPQPEKPQPEKPKSKSRSRGGRNRRSPRQGSNGGKSPNGSSSDASSPASSASELRTPESASEELPGVIVTDSNAPMTGLGLSLGDEQQVITAKLTERSTPETPRKVAVAESGDRTARNTPSSADRLQRSGSTMTLRGSAVVVPSVRAKIKALEQQRAAIRDFRGESCSPGGMGTPPRPGGTPTRTPTSGGRVASASAVLARRDELSASPSSKGLHRKPSTLSISSDAETSVSTNTDYSLRRPPSVMSFRAPMLKQ